MLVELSPNLPPCLKVLVPEIQVATPGVHNAHGYFCHPTSEEDHKMLVNHINFALRLGP